MIGGNVEAGLGLFGVEATHLVRRQTESGSLQAEILAGRAGIILRPAVRLIIVAEIRRRHRQ